MHILSTALSTLSASPTVGLLLAGELAAAAWMVERFARQTIKIRKQDQALAYERIFSRSLSRLDHEVYLLLRRSDTFPLYVAGDLPGLTGLTLEDMQRDIACFFQLMSAADAKTISQCAVKCFACVILLYCYQTRCTLTSLILTSYSVTRCLRSDHGYIDILRRFDASEVDVKAMSEHKHVALFQIWLDVFLVHICLQLIVDQDHDDISLFCSLCCGVYFKSLCLCFCPRLAALVKTDDNIASGLF